MTFRSIFCIVCSKFECFFSKFSFDIKLRTFIGKIIKNKSSKIEFRILEQKNDQKSDYKFHKSVH